MSTFLLEIKISSRKELDSLMITLSNYGAVLSSDFPPNIVKDENGSIHSVVFTIQSSDKIKKKIKKLPNIIGIYGSIK